MKTNRSGKIPVLRVQVQPNVDGTLSAVYFYIRSGKSVRTIEHADGNVFADYDRRGRLLGIELLGPCDIKLLSKIAREEPLPVRTFLRNAIPREMAIA